MSALKQVMQVIDSHKVSNRLLDSDHDKCGGLIANGQYAWYVSGSNIILYSKQLGSIVSSRSFAVNQKDKSLKITYIKELKNNEKTCDLILIGCSFKSSGVLFVCQLPTLTTIRCIGIPNPISYIATIINEPFAEDQFCDEFKIMSTILLVGMNTGAVYAVDLRQNYIEKQLRRNEVVVNELRPNKLFIIRKNEDCAEVKEMSDDSDSHLAIFLNENFYSHCKKYTKLNLTVSSLLYIEEINTIAIGYSTGHFHLWDCKIMRTIYLLKDPKCIMPVTHINFLEPSDDPNNLCYLWIMQSDNTKLPNATMIALTYEQRTVMPNGCLSYKVFEGCGIKLEMSLKRETGIGRCISALSLCNVNLFRNETDMDEDCEIKLFSMLMEIRQNIDDDPESYIFLFDINQWYKAQMPANITHLKVSNSYASFVKLPHNVSYLDFNISDKTLRPFGCNFRNNVEELYYPSSIYFECDCLVDKEIIRFKHAGVQQEILDQLLLKNWRLLINPSLVFNQCLQANLRPFFWDKADDYANYSLPDQRSFVISILVENKIMSVLSACAEEWKNGTYASSEATILHLVQCLWKHVMVVKQYADKLCVPLFDYSGTQLDKKNERILNHCLSQMQCVKNFLEDLHNAYGAHIINVDYSYRVYTLNLVTQYFKSVLCFLSYGLLPESTEQDPMQSLIQCDFTHLIQYANKRRTEFGDSQLYLIDALVNNEPKGNKLIEQWLHEGGEETKGLYPPSNVQCLLRIYLNAALSDQVKNFITIYFLIDVCSMKELDVLVANRMCNFALEFDVPNNKGLNALCRASWLFDHDLFKEAMEILAENKEWKKMNDKSWDWFHWVVLKLLVFKSEYFWARYYMKLINIDIVNIDDHKFYINLQIMNDQPFDAINYIRPRPVKEKQILFEYFFDRCREINKLKCLIEYLWEKEEENQFFSYLEKFKDAESLTFQLLFLLQRGKYLEAIELNKSSDVVNKLKCNDTLKITSNLVNGFEKSIPITLRNKSFERPHFQNLYKKRDIVVKCMNSDTKMFSITDKKRGNIFEKRNSSSMSSNLINLIIPANTNIRKRSPTNDDVYNEKRRKLINNEPDLPKASPDDVSVRPIGKQVLDILNTPLVEKTILSPSVTSCSSILKTGSAQKHKRVLSIKDDETPVSRTVLRFSLPDVDKSTINQLDSEKSSNVPIVNLENESFYYIENKSSEELSSTIIKQKTSIGSSEFFIDDFKSQSLNSISVTDKNGSIEDEKMDISECSEYIKAEADDMIEKETVSEITPISQTPEEIVLLTDEDEEDDKEASVSKLTHENSSIILNEDSEDSIKIISYSNVGGKNEVSRRSVLIDIEESSSLQLITMNSLNDENLKHNSQVNWSTFKETLASNEHILFPILSINSNDSEYVVEHISDGNDDDDDVDDDDVGDDDDDDNDDVILMNSEDENPPSEQSSSIVSLNEGSVSDESELDYTRYGRFKSHRRESCEHTDEGRSDESDIEEEEEKIDIEQCDDRNVSSEDNLSIDDVISSGDEIISSEDDEEKMSSEECDVSSEEDKTNSLEQSNDEYDENSEEENNLKQEFIEINDENDEEEILRHDYVKINDESEEEINFECDRVEIDNNKLKLDGEKNNEKNNLEQLKMKFDDNNAENDSEQQNVLYVLDSDENESELNFVRFDKSETHNSKNINDNSDDLSANKSCDFKLSKLENFTSCVFDLAEENNQSDYSCRDKNIETENYNVIENEEEEKIIDSNSKDNECYEILNIDSQENKFVSFEEIENNEKSINQIEEVGINAQEEFSFANNESYFEMSNRKSSPIPESGFNLPDSGFNLSTTEIEPNQLKMFEVDTNQSTPFLFGESFFGQQEIPEKKPMFLFGQVYSFEKEKFATESNNDEHNMRNAVSNNDKDNIVTNEPEEVVDTVDEIEDILELESLPESNPDDNSDAQNNVLPVDRSLRSKSEQPLDKITADLKYPFISLGPRVDTFDNSEKVSEHKRENQQSTQNSYRESLRKKLSKIDEYTSGGIDDASLKTRHSLRKLSNQNEKDTLKISNSFTKEQIVEDNSNQDKKRQKAKSIPPQNLDVIKTRSRAKSETNLVQLDTTSSNIFLRCSKIVEDNNRQVKVSLSKKRSVSQENTALAKRRSRRAKSLTPNEETINERRTAFGLEQIPEEGSTNLDENAQFKNTVKTRKSKFQFSSNKSKLTEYENTSLNVHEKREKTPRRSKSLQPETALTFSMVKTKPKRSSSVNLFVSDDENSTKSVDFMGGLMKALPIKRNKRSSTEIVENRKKQKFVKQPELPDNVESDTNGSSENSNDSNTFVEISPIAHSFHTQQHMLFTPARRTKIHMATLDSDNEDSSSKSDSVDSKRITTRSKIRKNSSCMEPEPESTVLPTPKVLKINPNTIIDKQKNTPEVEKSSKKITSKTDKNLLQPKRVFKTIKETTIDVSRNELLSTPERRVTRSQKCLLDTSLQSTSTMGQDEAIQNIPTPKPEKKVLKKTKPKKS